MCRVLSTNTWKMQYHYLVIILAGSTDDMAVLNMSLRSWCLSEDMTDRESTAPGWVVTLYSLSAEWSLCLDFRFFSGLDHDLVEYGMANLKLLKRLNNRCYHTGYDTICTTFPIPVIQCIFVHTKLMYYYKERSALWMRNEQLYIKYDNYKIYDYKMVQADCPLCYSSVVVHIKTRIHHLCQSLGL